ncbi:hypothetical protein [Neomoorella thermoacetica]|uniref:hypothetical protein n=1 Tax=Neomoorella thermoacetica TaxID=1525 RepID=UPI0008FB2570|nr:hypothetical protein [Moorella thermoacetica]OIQ55614.1 hypothetical protein MORE_04720 [Moorella thermoacetica]
MLKEVLNEIFEEIHDLGHPGTAVDKMMDAVEGMGHRIKWGHDLQGMINAFELEGVSGIFDWFKHMLLDLASPSGVPLPFADAVRVATGMEMDEAIDWLCVNLADVVEVGTEATVLRVFKDDPRKFKVALAVGTAIGIADDNPVLLALNTVVFLKMFGWQGGFSRAWAPGSFFSRSLDVLSKVATGLAVADIALGLMGFDLVELFTGLGDAADFSEVTEFGEMLGDFLDGMVTFGLIRLVNRGIRGAFDALTQGTRERLWRKRAVHTALEALKAGLRQNAPFSNLVNFVRAAKDSGYYTTQLQEGA